MSKQRRAKYHVRKRIFLNRDLDMRAFAIGIVQDTREIPDSEKDDWQWGTIELTLSDCYRHISFDFSLSSKENRANSLYKIKRIAEIVNHVRAAIEIEVESINERENKAAIKSKPAAKAKSAAG